VPGTKGETIIPTGGGAHVKFSPRNVDDEGKSFAAAGPMTVRGCESSRSGWFVDVLAIRCVSCGQAWSAPLSYSVYERQALESCPCPQCSSYPLCCSSQPAAGSETASAVCPEPAF